MANAHYAVTISGTNDETFVFSILFDNVDGTAFPFADLEIESVAAQNGSGRFTWRTRGGMCGL